MGRKIVFAAVCGLFGVASASGDHTLLGELRQHLSLARKSAAMGRAEGAVAHASVVAVPHRLTVRVSCGNLPASAQGPYRNAVSGAFRMWEAALGENVFEFVSAGSADVTITFQGAVRNNGADVCGHVNWIRGVLDADTAPRFVLSADMRIRMFDPAGQQLTFEQLRACIAHELGHVLGLADSPRAGDVMAPMDLKRPVLTVRPDEVRSLIMVRREALQIHRTFAVRSNR